MTNAASLRLRLTAIILAPLMTLAVLVGLWQLEQGRRTAADVFDRSLLSAALAVANDVAVSGGDALSARTRDLLTDTSGGNVFYHVYAPDGVIVTGYATPPVGIPRSSSAIAEPTYFDARYRGSTVRGVRLQTQAVVDGFSGIFTTTVWQDREVRDEFVSALVLQSSMAILALVLSLALIVWFGVRVGLKPLENLERAIALRSSADLGPIRRAVPAEVTGIVETLNRLFGQVSRAMSAQSEFIANAAHQLRNPIAGVLSLAEAVASAPSEAAAKERAQDLLAAARETAELSHKLLTLERAEALTSREAFSVIDLAECLPRWIDDIGRTAPEAVSIACEVSTTSPAVVRADATMMREAVVNLIDNALRHGGTTLSRISAGIERDGDAILLSVEDDGAGIQEADIPRALERFTRLGESASSGLGLSIVRAIAEGHDGRFEIAASASGLRATIRLPVLAS